MDQLLTQATIFLRNAPFTWALCGGYALDMFHGRALRAHGDIDICALEIDRAAILAFMLEKGWQVYEFRGQGKVRPLDASSLSESGRNLMCFTDDCPLVRFYPCEDEGLMYHQFLHTNTPVFNYVEFLFNQTIGDRFVFSADMAIERTLSQAVLMRSGIPYLAPELVLMYKASQPELDKNLSDFRQTYPLMSDEQKYWFVQSLSKLYPGGNPWRQML